MLTRCEFEKCPMGPILTPSKDMFTCSCGCDKTMHKGCIIQHNRMITHLIQTHREVSKWRS